MLQRVAISPDGQAIAAASSTGVTLHDADNLNALWSTTEAAYIIGALGWSADGARILVGRYLPPERRQLEIVQLDVRNAGVLDSLTIEGGHPLIMAFSPDGRQALIEDINTDEWRVIELATGDETVVLDRSQPGDEVLWLPDGRLVVGTSDFDAQTYRLYAWGTDQVLIDAAQTGYFEGQMAFSPDSTRAALTMYDVDPVTNEVVPRTYLYNLNSGAMIWRIAVELRNLLWLDDETLLGAKGSAFDRTVVRIDAAAGEVVDEFVGGPLPLEGLGQLHSGPPGQIIGTTPDSLHVYDAETYDVLAEATDYVDATLSGQFSPDSTWIMTTLGTSLRIWESQTGVQQWQLDNVVGRGDWSPDGRRIAVVDALTGQVGVWTWTTGAGGFRFETGLFSPGAALWLADDHLLVSATSRLDQGLSGFVEEYALALFDLESGEQISREDTDARVEVAAAPLDGEVFAYALSDPNGEGDTLVVANSESGESAATMTIPIGNVRALAWSPDGTQVAGAFAFQVAIWSRNGARLAVPEIPEIIGEVSGLGWSADGTVLFGLGRHRSGPETYILVWDAATGDLLMPTVRMSEESLIGLTTSRDGLLLVEHNGRLEVWSLSDALP